MKRKSAFSFKAPLDPYESALISTVIYIPALVSKDLPQSRVRVKGTMNGAPFSLAVQYRKSGKSFFIVGGPLRKAAGIRRGSIVQVEFRIISDRVELPAEMKAVLEQDDEGRKAWELLTPGLQRGVCHYVNGVKNIDSRIKRALLLIEKVKQGAYTKPEGKEKISSLHKK